MMRQPRVFILFVMSLNFVIALVYLLLVGGVHAQDDKGEPLPQGDGVRFDSYPHPLSTGALAYSIADRWDYTDLTYYFDNCPDTVSCEDGQDAVRAGFQAWADISPLTFSEVSNPNQADIELAWSNRGPELGYPGDILAYATFPHDGGDVFFDDSEPWTLFDGSEFDLVLVATHEIGHALGLNHSSDPGALMYPVLTGLTHGLSSDDAAAIQALYGQPEEAPPRDVPQAEEVSGQITNDVPYELWEFEAFAGETLTFTMQATSGNLSPRLGLLTDDEETVLADSGPSDGDVAQMTYTFEDDGIFVIMATRDGVEEGSTTGSYVLQLNPGEAEEPQVAPPVDGNAVLVDIRSYSPNELCEVYFSPSSSEDWGANLLDFTLTNGNYIDLEAAPGLYDVLAVGCDGTELEEYEIDVSQDLAIEIYEDDINAFLYGE